MTASNDTWSATLRSIDATNTLVVGTVASAAQGMTYESLAHSLTLLLHNATTTQFGAKQVENAAVAAACAQIIKAGASAP
jgi:hypothetical protein